MEETTVSNTKDAYPLAEELKKIRAYIETVGSDSGDVFDVIDQMETRLKGLIGSKEYYDALTSLPNRELFKDRFSEAMLRARRSKQMMAVMALGLDNFKNINNSLGRSVGDMLLKEVSGRLVTCLREVDTIARFGGDEFNILLENIEDAQGAVIAAEKIIKSLADPFMFEGDELFITVSIGLTYFPTDGETYDTMIRNADIAMSRTKELGKNSYQIFTSALDEKIKRRLELENFLRKAVEKNEFVVYYQPKVNIMSGAILGMEALVRWRRSDGKMISPGEFIPLAESTGLIVPIGEQVMRTACTATKGWHEMGFEHLIVSVNLAARQLDQDDILDVVASVLDDTGLPSSGLCLEVTESSMMNDLDKTLETLNAFKEMGIKVSMDDFGTGYSSLSHLKKFPIDELKIDRSFVMNLPHAADDSAIANTIISMAHALNLKVIAEGVEKKDQLEFLRDNGCGEIQGYLFSPPVPADEFEALLLKRHGSLEPEES